MTKSFKLNISIGIYFVVIFFLFLYSFTQIDLSLTFSRITVLRNLVTSFQQIGYFNRPLSMYIYIGLLILLYGFYFYFLKLSLEKKISKKTVWKILIASSAILVFSYNAFSYDLFNYIFDAKIFTHYHLNPYVHKALDFPGDPMLSFMRWTHRVYPYGPIWLLLTVPLSFIGFNFFLPTFFMFKILMAASFLGSLCFIGKILQKTTPNKEIFGLVFFGLNPLVIIESLVSGHLDIVMVFFALWATHKLVEKKYALPFLLLALSTGIKFGTIFLLPIFIYILFLQKKKKSVDWDLIFKTCTIAMVITVFLSSTYSGNFQPWYLVLPLAFAVFISRRYYIFIPCIIISFFALLMYLPFLYLGNWDKPVPQILWNLQISSMILSFIAVLVYYLNLSHPFDKLRTRKHK